MKLETFQDFVWIAQNGRVVHLFSRCSILIGKKVRKMRLLDLYAKMADQNKKGAPVICKRCQKKLK